MVAALALLPVAATTDPPVPVEFDDVLILPVERPVTEVRIILPPLVPVVESAQVVMEPEAVRNIDWPAVDME